LILKHFENVALDEVKLVLRENVKNIGDTVKHFMINVMKTLEDKDFVRLDALKESFDSLKTEAKITQPFIKQIIEDFSTPTTETDDDNNNKDSDKNNEKPIKSKLHGKVSVGSMPAKNLALATGAAVVASAFTASTNTKIFKDAKLHDGSKSTNLLTPYSDVTGVAVINNPSDVGHTDSSIRELFR